MKNILLLTLPNFTDQLNNVFVRVQEEGNRMYLLSDGSAQVSPRAFTDHFAADITDTNKAMAALPEGLKFDAVVCDWIDRLTPLAALIGKKHGTIGNSPQTAYACRSKHKMRQILSEAGIPGAKAILCRSFDDISRAVHLIKGPCVAKPVGADSSSGVFFIGGPSALGEVKRTYEESITYLEAQRAEKIYFSPSDEDRILMGVDEDVDFVSDYLVEEFIEGTPLSIDSLVQNGKATIMGVAEQIRMAAPFFIQLEERMPFVCPATTMAEITAFNQRVISAFGITDSAVHLEIRVGPTGPRVIEIACRFGGDNIHDSVLRTTGHSIMYNLIKICLGEPVDLSWTPRCHTAMKYLLPEKKGIFHSLQIPPAVLNDADVTEIWDNFKPGTPLAPPPECYDTVGYVQVKGETQEAAVRKLEEVCNLIEVTYE